MIAGFQNAKILIASLRTLNGYAPCRTVRFRAECLHIAAEIDHAVFNAVFLKNLHDTAGRIPLCNTAKINLRIIF